MINNANNASSWSRGRWRSAIWIIAGLLMLLPLIAMQFSDEVHWSVGDFILAGILLGGSGILYELAVRKSANIAYRAAVGIAIAAAFILVWVNGAVGIIGNEGNNSNLMYSGVLVLGIIGAILTRFRPLGMARVMFGMAFALAVVGLIALAQGLGSTGPIWPLDILGATGLFVVLFIGSGLLFRKAVG